MHATLLGRRGRRTFLATAALGGAAILASAHGSGPGAASGPELHLALLSDTHIAADRSSENRGFNPWNNLRAAVAQVAAARPDGVVLSGDAARLEGRPEDYAALRQLLEPLAAVAPVYVAPGNHDERAAFTSAFGNGPGLRAPVPDRLVTVIEHPALRVIVLDSLLYTNKVPGLLGQAQRRWLETYLPTVAERPVVLVLHHPPGDSDDDLLDGDRLLGLVRANPQVKALFHGHAHVWAVSRREGLPIVSLPSLGYNFADDQPVGWVDARFTAVGATLTLHALAGNRAADGQTTLVEWSK